MLTEEWVRPMHHQDTQRQRDTALLLDGSACAQCLPRLWMSGTLRGYLDTTGYSCDTWSEEIKDRDPIAGAGQACRMTERLIQIG